MRKRLIDELAQERGSIDGGVVDAENGIVYRIAPTAAGRRKSLWRVAGIFTLVGLETTLAFFAGPLFLTGWPVKKFGYATLLANYLFLFLGVIAHLLIDALKQKRVQVKPNFAAMDDWLI